MRVDPITGFQTYVAPIADITEDEPVNPIKKIIDNSYYQDTIDLDPKKSFQAKVKDVISDHAKTKDTLDVHGKEHYLNLAFINAMSAQRQNHEDSSILSLESLKETMSSNNDLRTELYDQQQGLINKQKKSDILKIADAVTMAGLVVTGVVSVGLVLVLGFATVPIVLVGLTSLFALVNGATKIANGVTKFQVDQITSQIFELGERRKMNHTKATDETDKQNGSKEKVFDTYKMMSENETKKQETVRAIVARS
jgi:ABC-type multidrug transport system fused ATPase/permease subunit